MTQRAHLASSLWMRYQLLRRQIVRFFLGSLAGVSMDLVGFNMMVFLGATPVIANMVSAGLGIVVTYFLVTRYAFATPPSPRYFAGFIAWYAFSITSFSFAIGAAVTILHSTPFFCKLLSLPFSFLINFIFSRFFLSRSALCPTVS